MSLVKLMKTVELLCNSDSGLLILWNKTFLISWEGLVTCISKHSDTFSTLSISKLTGQSYYKNKDEVIMKSLVPLPFLKPAWTSGSSQFTYCWSLAWRLLSITLTSVWDECNCVVVWAFFGIAFLWDWNEDWHFPVLWPLLNFPNLLAYWVQHLHSIIFQDLE